MKKKKDPQGQRGAKASLWSERVAKVTGGSSSEVEALLTKQRTHSVRTNPLKSPSDVLSEYQLEPISWADAHCVSADKPTLQRLNESMLVQEGKVYLQNAASWLPVFALTPQAGENILDVCAAPGGKASHIQALTMNQSQLTCNDNSKPRLMKLQQNMQRLGAEAQYTLCDATRLSRNFAPQSFDKIIIDAPCSGEGLMSLRPEDAKLFDSWSVAHIRRLSDLQKKILRESWQLLKPGGTLVYSTCTMAPEENETVVDHFLSKQDDATLIPIPFALENRITALRSWNDRPYRHDLSNCLRLLPGKLTEAFFVAKLTKHID